MSKTRIVLIAGAGRSGSTIASLLLAQSRDVTNVGEVNNLWRDGFAEGIRCGCGKRYRQCELWTAVVRDAYGGFDQIPTGEIRRVWASVYRNIRVIPRLMTGTMSAQVAKDR